MRTPRRLSASAEEPVRPGFPVVRQIAPDQPVAAVNQCSNSAKLLPARKGVKKSVRVSGRPLHHQIAAAFGINRDRVLAHQWVDNGSGWAVVQLPAADFYGGDMSPL